MKLSVIFLNDAQESGFINAISRLNNACIGIEYEVLVIPGQSKSSFSEISLPGSAKTKVVNMIDGEKLIATTNRAFELCSGEYILLVTPDTKYHKDAFRKMIAFMDAHPDAGGITVRLVNPEGQFASNVVRGLDKNWSAFFRFIGFGRNLTKSRLNDHSVKGVDEFRITEIDILNSSCMFLRRSAVSEVGLFDERFYKYGNIDLSYRLRLAGYRNFYFPKTYFVQSNNQVNQQHYLDFVRLFIPAALVFLFKYLIKLPDIKSIRFLRIQPSSLSMEP